MNEVDTVNQKIWEKWSSGDDHCEGCPNHHDEFPPFYGYGSRNAKIAIIGEGPRDKSGRDQASGVPDVHREKIESSYTLQDILVKDPTTGTSRIPEEFFKRLNVHVDLKTHFEGEIYYTNARKCAGTKQSNDKALDRCKNYLHPELDALEPDVILPVSKNSTISVYYAFDIERDSFKFGDEILKPATGSPPYILPSYHWGYSKRSQMNHLNYWLDVAETVNEYL